MLPPSHSHEPTGKIPCFLPGWCFISPGNSHRKRPITHFWPDTYVELGGERGIGREKHRSLLCERLRGWHAKCVWSTTEHTTPSSHHPPRPGDTMKPEFPGRISRAARCGIPADRLRSPHEAQRPPRLRWARRGKQRRRRIFANASRSLALRSGLVVCAEPEC